MTQMEQRMARGSAAGLRGAVAAALLRLAAGQPGGVGIAHAAAVAPPPSAVESPHLRLREALLHEARERLGKWYKDEQTLELPFFRDNAQVRMSKAECFCDGPDGTGKVPLTFGEFSVEGARPVDVFNVLTDSKNQTKWDPTVSQVEEIVGKWEQTDGVKGVEQIYPTGIIMVPPREITEWVAYEADFKQQEFWVVYSTVANRRLHEARPRADGTVPAENCLGGYWIRPRPDGGAHVLFTQHVNSHPPLMLSAKFVFTVSWGKQIDYINQLRKKSQEQAALSWAASRTIIPDELLHDPVTVVRPATSAAWAGTHSAFREVHAGFFRLYRDAGPRVARGMVAMPVAAAAALCAAALLMTGAVVAVASRRRRSQARRAVMPGNKGLAGGAAEAASLLEEPAADGSIAA